MAAVFVVIKASLSLFQATHTIRYSLNEVWTISLASAEREGTILNYSKHFHINNGSRQGLNLALNVLSCSEWLNSAMEKWIYNAWDVVAWAHNLSAL